MTYTDVATMRIITGFTGVDSMGDPLVSDTTITRAVDQAEAIVNGAVASVYQLPFSSPPDLVSSITEQIAKALLYAEEYGEETENLDKGWKKTFDFQLNILDLIKQGKVYLIDSNGIEYPRSTIKIPSFYPNDASEVSLTDPTYSHITVNKKW